MKLTQLTLKNFRNFQEITINPDSNINLLVGANGKGKTSVLEAIYFLGMGRSFRARGHQAVVQHGQTSCQMVGEFLDAQNNPIIIGIEKNLDASQSQAKISGREVQNMAELASILPVQLIHHETFHLLDAGPQYRREFLDWGVFYAEPLYFPAWQRAQRALKQRNALLKNNLDLTQLNFWEQELASQAQALDQFRRMYLTLYLPVLESLLAAIGLAGISITYHAGWDNQRDYVQLLHQSRARDAILGHTSLGPHRADLKIRINQQDADYVLSRGQQKMLSFSMRIAQALLLAQLSQQQCLFLVDDLAAELDSEYINQAMQMLVELPCQVFITAVHKILFEQQLAQYDIPVFHVEQL
ncbi:MAG: recombinase RecF [Gammaproteobacteria bacterium]|jgi:DNA replication and repair protein RecF|nr:recombinase RecF [Gammaproteobacteria bacterium]